MCAAFLRGIMTDQDAVLAAFEASHPEGFTIVAGRPGARYLMNIEKKLLTFMVDGEPESRDFTDAFAQAFSCGRLDTGCAVLIDLVRFTGAVDWGAVKALHDTVNRQAWGIKKVAYLVRDMQFAPLAKIAGAIFAEMEHVVFDDKNKALAWLSAPG